MESTMDTSAFSHATKEPTWAISTATPADLRKVLLPPMFGPVMMWKRPDSVSGGRSERDTEGGRERVRFIMCMFVKGMVFQAYIATILPQLFAPLTLWVEG